MTDEELEKMQRELYAAVTQQERAHEMQRQVTQQASQERQLLDNQIKSVIQTQMYKDSQAISNMSGKVELQGQRINALTHSVTAMNDTVSKVMDEIKSTATLDTLYAEREKALSQYYEQLREDKENEYRRKCAEIDRKEEERRQRAHEHSEQMIKEWGIKATKAEEDAKGRIQYTKTEIEEYQDRLKRSKAKWKKRTFAVCISFVVSVLLGFLVGLLIVKGVF